jgi:hypothetical protein
MSFLIYHILPSIFFEHYVVFLEHYVVFFLFL